jgi:hypothetical protein
MKEKTLLDLINTVQFKSILAMTYMSIFTGLFIVGSSKIWAEKFIRDEEFLTMVASLGGIFGALRFIWSFCLDKYSFKAVYGALLCLQMVCCFMLPITLETIDSP